MNIGIHTFSLNIRTSYSNIQNILQKNEYILKSKDKYHLNKLYCIAKYKKYGIEIWLHQSIEHPSFVRIIINPSSLLAGEYRPTDLFKANNKNINRLEHKLRNILDDIGIDYDSSDIKLSRCDLTKDIYFSSYKDIMSMLKIFKKSYISDKRLQIDENKNSWTVKNKSREFCVYNKTYELKNRHNIDTDDNILRLELRLYRKAMNKKYKENSWTHELLNLYSDYEKLIDSFICKIHQDFKWIVSYKKAIKTIDKSKYREKTKKLLKQIIKNASICNNLADTRKKCRIRKDKFINLLNKFSEMGICAITKD